MVCSNESDSNARPTEYTAEIGETICDRLVDGHSIYRICSDPTMPSRATLYEWLVKDEAFRKQFAFIEWSMAIEFEHELIDIADECGDGWVEKVSFNGRIVTVEDRQQVARCRLRIDVRCWVADQQHPNNPVKFSTPRKGYGK